MKVIVALMVLSISTLEYSEAITSEVLCEQLKSNQRRILTMGARGRTLDDAHFYILTDGGYLFKVPLSNLHLDSPGKTTSITIDREHIRADTLFGLSPSVFTHEEHNLFFLVSNANLDMFLGRMFFHNQKQDRTIFQLYSLEGGPTPNKLQLTIKMDKKVLKKTSVIASFGINSYEVNGLRLVKSKLILRYTFVADNDFSFVDYRTKSSNNYYQMDFSSNTQIVTAYYHKEDQDKEAGYYYYLDAAGLVTVTRRKNTWDWVTLEPFGRSIDKLYSERFEVKLSSFIVCRFEAVPVKTDLPQTTPQTSQQTSPSPKQTTRNVATAETDQPGQNWTYWAVPLGAIVVVLGAIVLFCTFCIKQKHQMNMMNKQVEQLQASPLYGTSIAPPNACSNASPSPTTTTSSVATSRVSSSFLQSVKSKLASLIKGNKSKQAKAGAKGKKAKERKPKKSKRMNTSPKSGA